MGEQKFAQMTKMPWYITCLYMLKTLKNVLLRNQKALKLSMHHRVLEYYQICSNDDWVDLDLFYGKVKYVPLYFCMGKR